MAYGKKSIPKIEIGDILFADATVSFYDLPDFKTVAFDADKGVEMGEVVEVTSKYYKVDTTNTDFDEIDYFYIKISAQVHPMANTDYDYPDSSNGKKAATNSSSSGSGVLDYIKLFFGFGTEVLKATNAKNADASTKNADGTDKTDTSGKDAADPNATGNQTGNKTWYYVAGAVILIVILVIVFWKPKPTANQPVEYVSNSNQLQQLNA